MQTGPFWLLLAFALAALLALLWATAVLYILYAVATRPEFAPERDATTTATADALP